MGIALTPHDAAKTILFLSCEDSSGITGTALVIDAGYLTAAEWKTNGHTAFMESPDTDGNGTAPRRRGVRAESRRVKR